MNYKVYYNINGSFKRYVYVFVSSTDMFFLTSTAQRRRPIGLCGDLKTVHGN